MKHTGRRDRLYVEPCSLLLGGNAVLLKLKIAFLPTIVSFASKKQYQFFARASTCGSSLNFRPPLLQESQQNGKADAKAEVPVEPAHMQAKADHNVPSEVLAAAVAQGTSGVAEPSDATKPVEAHVDGQVLEAGQETGGSEVPQDNQSGQPGSLTETGVLEGAENGKRKIDGEDETAAKRTKVDESGAAMEQEGVKLWDVNRDGAEELGVERRGKRTIDFRGKLYLAPLTTVG